MLFKAPEIQLEENDKLIVLLIGLALLLCALFFSICLAAPPCPLNFWLSRRHSERQLRKRRERAGPSALEAADPHSFWQRRTRSPLATSDRKYGSSSITTRRPNPFAAAGPPSPPPDYESSLAKTGANWPPAITKPQDGEEAGEAAQPNSGSSGQPAALDSKEVGQTPESEGPEKLLVRIWFRLLESQEIGRRVRGEAEKRRPALTRQDSSRESRVSLMSLNRQLSFPQLFGSLVSLATATGPATTQSNGTIASATREPESASSTANACQLQQERQSAADTLAAAADPKTPGHERQRAPTARLLGLDPIASRILHMNVASLSYSRDQQLISSQLHRDTNERELISTTASTQLNDHSAASPAGSEPMCQAMISISDIAGVLTCKSLREQAAWLLSSHGALYLRCELLSPSAAPPKSRGARFLKPLLNHTNQAARNQSRQDSLATTAEETIEVDFSAQLPAATFERTIALPIPMSPGPNELLASTSNRAARSREQQARSDAALGACENRSDSQSNTSSSQSESNSLVLTAAGLDSPAEGSRDSGARTPTAKKANSKQPIGRHQQPTLDHKQMRSVFVFSTVSKQVSGFHDYDRQAADLTQFDSVFVSPILRRSLLESSVLRIRLFGQCKYVNELCLAELSLPVADLMQEQVDEDRLAGKSRAEQQQWSQQLDFVLEKVLSNLVTAATGSPLSELLEPLSPDPASDEYGGQVPPGLALNCSYHSQSGANSAATKESQLIFLNQRDQHDGRTPSSSSWMQDETDYRHGQEEDNDELSCLNQQEEQLERLIEQNYCRSLMVSHWLNYLSAPSYPCPLLQEPRGSVLLGCTYLPTSNRVIFNANRAQVDCHRLAKTIRLNSGALYQLRFMMVVGGRVARKRDTKLSLSLEWDSQEAITFDLLNLLANPTTTANCSKLQQRENCDNFSISMSYNNYRNVDYHQNQQQNPRFVVCLVARVAQDKGASGSSSPAAPPPACGSRVAGSPPPRSMRALRRGPAKVLAHFVLADDLWLDFRSTPRKQIVRQYKMY